MIGLDTNVVVRFLVEDEPAQTARVRRRLQAALAQRQRLLIADPVLCEVVWVLEDCYGFTRREIAQALESLLATAELTFQSQDCAERAVASFKTGKADFADYLIGEICREAGCDVVLSFDRALLREPRFEAP